MVKLGATAAPIRQPQLVLLCGVGTQPWLLLPPGEAQSGSGPGVISDTHAPCRHRLFAMQSASVLQGAVQAKLPCSGCTPSQSPAQGDEAQGARSPRGIPLTGTHW